jgi:hypothetical protein
MSWNLSGACIDQFGTGPILVRWHVQQLEERIDLLRKHGVKE